MTHDAAPQSPPAARKTFGWWVAAILTPAGLIGGPLAVADMFAGAIQWNGWVKYLVVFWDEKVSHAFGIVFNFVAAKFDLPTVAESTVDYLTLGILLSGSFIRAVELFPFGSTNANGPAPRLWMKALLFLAQIVAPLLLVAIWPFYLIALSLILIAMSLNRITGNKLLSIDMGFAIPTLFMTLAPFAVFLALYAINSTMA